MNFNKSLFFVFAIFSFTNMQATSSTSHITTVNPKDIVDIYPEKPHHQFHELSYAAGIHDYGPNTPHIITPVLVTNYGKYSARLADGVNIMAEKIRGEIVCTWINIHTGDKGTCDAANFQILKEAYAAKQARIAAEEKTKNPE